MKSVWIDLEGAAPSAPHLHPMRKQPAHHPVHDHNGRSVIVFLTVCTHERKPILARADAMAVLRKAWSKAKLWRVGRWVLMPDHVHLFCSPATVTPESLERWVSYWKAEAARHWPRGDEHPLWQRDFWDTQLRHADSYNTKWSYVRLNPVRKGLVDCEAAWPFQGEENVLRWRE
jgi:putative transposase